MDQEFCTKSLVKLESIDRFCIDINEYGHMFLSTGKKGSNNYWSGDENHILDFLIRLDNLVEIPDLMDNDEFDYSDSYNSQFMFSDYESGKYDEIKDQYDLRDDFINEFNKNNIDIKSISKYILDSIKTGDGLYELTGGDEMWHDMIYDVFDFLDVNGGVEFRDQYEIIQNHIIDKLYKGRSFEKLYDFIQPGNFNEEDPITIKDGAWDERLFEEGTHYVCCPKGYLLFSGNYSPTGDKYFNDFKKFYLGEDPYNKGEYKYEKYEYGEYRKVITRFLLSDNPTIEKLFSLIHYLRKDYLPAPENYSPVTEYTFTCYAKLKSKKAKKLYYKYTKRNRDLIDEAIKNKDKEKIKDIVERALPLTDDQLEFIYKFLGFDDADQLFDKYYDEYMFSD